MKYFILLGFCICLYLLTLPESNTERHHEKNFLLYSSFYYNKSKIYSNDTLVMLFIAPKDIKEKDIKFDCFSVNITLLQTNDLKVRLGHRFSKDKEWKVFIATCTTARNPHIVGLTVPLAPKVIEINVQYPIQASYPVAICYPPRKYEHRWQQLIYAIEMNQYFGTDMQIYYLDSASKEVTDILDVYEAKGWIRIEKYFFHNFKINNGFSNKQRKSLIEFSNHYLASTDCLMKYREAADYIIFADIDDLIVPQQNSYYAEFLHWSKRYPFATGFHYFQSRAIINFSNNISNFSLLSSVNSLKVEKQFFNGRTVFRTNSAEIVWFIFPELNNGTIINIEPEDAKIYHFIMLNKINKKETRNFKPHNLLPQKDVAAIQYEFTSVFENFSTYAKNSINPEHILSLKKKEHCILKKCFFTFCPKFLKHNSSFKTIPVFSLSSYYPSCNFVPKDQ